MIEIRTIEGAEEWSERYKLLIDGSPVEDVLLSYYKDTPQDKEHNRFDITTGTHEATERIATQSLSEMLERGLRNFRLLYEPDWLEAVGELWILEDDEEDTFSLWFSFNRLSRWRREYAFRDYYEALAQRIRDEGVLNVNTPAEDKLARSVPTESFIIEFTSCSIEVPLAEEVERCSVILRGFHERVESELLARIQSGSVVVSFNFPEEVRIPCEQYLLYFAQFLRDLGVSADTALTHEAGQVLFTVTPEDKEQALDNIRAALEVYLHLPSSPVSDAEGNEIAVLRLSSELQSLQSRLSLARAEIQMKEAAIQLQKVTIAQLTGEVIIESLKDVTPKPKDKEREELLGDIVSLVPIKGKGFEVNLPELLRKLKQLFKKENRAS